jgi:hypothetical protein
LPILLNPEVVEANPSGTWWPARRNICSNKNRGIKRTLSLIQSAGEGAVCNAERKLKELLIIICSEKVQDCWM